MWAAKPTMKERARRKKGGRNGFDEQPYKAKIKARDA
jgi:hypothetical protein